jgi:hypothetical protein
MKHLFLILCIFLSSCCQGVTYRPTPQNPSAQVDNGGFHMGSSTPDEPLAHTQHGMH